MNAPTDDAPYTGPTPYELLGGEAGVRSLVDRFYDLMDLEAAYAGIRRMHPPALDESRDKLFWFLSGWLGGPPLFAQFAIGVAERDAWLACIRQAMEEEGVDEGLRKVLAGAFFGTADWMRNRAEKA